MTFLSPIDENRGRSGRECDRIGIRNTLERCHNSRFSLPVRSTSTVVVGLLGGLLVGASVFFTRAVRAMMGLGKGYHVVKATVPAMSFAGSGRGFVAMLAFRNWPR